MHERDLEDLMDAEERFYPPREELIMTHREKAAKQFQENL